MAKNAGNMYEDVDDTRNFVKGICFHDCTYCYMHKINTHYKKTPKPVYFDEKMLTRGFGKNKVLFIGSSCDMWAENIPADWIYKTLEHCEKYPDNEYIFQTKNPKRFWEFFRHGLNNVHYGTTIETNRVYPCMGKAPPPAERAKAITNYEDRWEFPGFKFRTFITIEPILDFDLDQFVLMLKNANPTYINIGADSGHNNLPEPPKEKIIDLISELEKFTKVKIKKNLKRIIGENT
jgi:DNA repair photolyase